MLSWDTSVGFGKRMCARRILSYLKRYHLEGAAHELERETAVFFDVSHVQDLARNSRWDDLISYVAFFFEPSPDGHLRSLEACTFLCCLDLCRALGKVAKPGSHPKGLFSLIRSGDPKYSRSADLCELLFQQDLTPQRPPTTWVQVWEEAAERLKDLALECPELKGKLHPPRNRHAPNHCQINLAGCVFQLFILSYHACILLFVTACAS